MYELTWITDHLATGHAPMSYDELDSIREQGIGAIVNLCGEFCDLHEIEESSGFDVYYLPVVDEYAPDLEAMEKALDWMDEALYLDKKVLVHCRLGHGRTGTFIAAYLLRRGFDFKAAEKTMKGRNANPATYHQRSFLKKYGKQVGSLKAAKPKIDNRPDNDAAALLQAFAELIDASQSGLPPGVDEPCCGRGDHACCHLPFDLQLIESMYLSHAISRGLKQGKREEVVGRALALAAQLKVLHAEHPGQATGDLAGLADGTLLPCPLLEEGDCLIFAQRPLRCRFWNSLTDGLLAQELLSAVRDLSRQAYETLTGRTPPGDDLWFSSADTISGKFVQLYFQALAAEPR